MDQPLMIVRANGIPCPDNQLYRRRRRSAYGQAPRGGDVYLSPKAREWHTLVAQEAWLQLRLLENGRQRLPAEGELRVACTFSNVRGDAPNYLKATLDGLAEGLQMNDQRFNPVVAARRSAKGQPVGVIIEIYAVAA
jgi:Holliday junction resolvase RusA-like endonuclease